MKYCYYYPQEVNMKSGILPINEKPSIITCIHHAYPCAIIESKELAYIIIENFNSTQWNKITYDTTIQINNNTIKILEKETGNNTNVVLWRECNIRDETIINIDYIKPNDSSRHIDIFLFCDDLQEELEREDKTCGIRWNPYGYFIMKNMYSYDTKAYTYLKFCVDKNIINGFASKDGIEWKYLDQIALPNYYNGKKLNIGIHMYFGKNYFNIWKNMNFIQLLYNDNNPNKGIHLDYYFFPRKNVDNSYSYFPNFLDTHYDLLYDAMDCFTSIHKYLHWNIQHLYYIELCLDEFFVVHRAAYGKYHYNHYNLFYGFDDEKEVYYVMGYGERNTPIISEIPYDVLDLGIINSEKIIRYKYSSNDITTLKFNIKPVITSLYEFLNNVNSSEKVSNLLTEEDVSFGINILKTLASTENGRYLIRSDKRISFCLTEHSKLMKERLNYLYNNKYLEKKEYELLAPQCDDIIHTSSGLLLQVLKNAIKPICSESIDNSLITLYNIEQDFCSNLLDCLRKRL